MPSTTGYRQGDIVLVSFPFTDLASAKRGPALVISPDSFHAWQEDLVLAAVTSQISTAPGSVLIGPADTTDGTLPKESMLRLGKLFTLHSSLVLKRLCRLTPNKRKSVIDELVAFFTN